jgi:hypothetical protein
MTDNTIQAALDAAEAAMQQARNALGEPYMMAPREVGPMLTRMDQSIAALRTAVEGLREVGQPVSGWTREHHIALREGHCWPALNDYFTPRPVQDDAMSRRAFEAGFERGFDTAAELLAAAPPSPAQSVGEVEPTEALYAFAGWLTSRDTPITMGATHYAAEAAEAVEAFVKSQGWPQPRHNWMSRIKPYPSGATPASAPPAEPVVVAENADADAMNKLHGESYGIDWVYPADALPAEQQGGESAQGGESQGGECYTCGGAGVVNAIAGGALPCPRKCKPAEPAAPDVVEALQASMNNAQLTDAWLKKLPGVTPTERDLTAFALGAEVGFARARDLDRQDWSRFHHLMAKHGLHPGRTDDDLLEILDAALSTPARRVAVRLTLNEIAALRFSAAAKLVPWDAIVTIARAVERASWDAQGLEAPNGA